MLLHLSDQSSDSLQNQIVKQIRAKVLAGELAADGGLPSIRALARNHRVSVITVQRAYESLERQGLIHSRRGKGFFVSQTSAATRQKLATAELAQRIRHPLRQALAEGLSVKTIERVVARIIAREEEPQP